MNNYLASEPNFAKAYYRQKKKEMNIKEIFLRSQRSQKVSTILFVVQIVHKSYLKSTYYQTFVLYMYIEIDQAFHDIDKAYHQRYGAFRKQYDGLKTSIYMMAKKGYKKTKGPFSPYLIHFLAHTLIYPEECRKYEHIDDVEYGINSLYKNNRIPHALLPLFVGMLPETLQRLSPRKYDDTWVKNVAPYVSDAIKEENRKNKECNR